MREIDRVLNDVDLIGQTRRDIDRGIADDQGIFVPGHKDPLIISDAAVNISPSLADKVHIVQNAIDLAHARGLARAGGCGPSRPETVNHGAPTTLEASSRRKMA